nr:putative potassium transporter 17 [Quercus suber]
MSNSGSMSTTSSLEHQAMKCPITQEQCQQLMAFLNSQSLDGSQVGSSHQAANVVATGLHSQAMVQHPLMPSFTGKVDSDFLVFPKLVLDCEYDPIFDTTEHFEHDDSSSIQDSNPIVHSETDKPITSPTIASIPNQLHDSFVSDVSSSSTQSAPVSNDIIAQPSTPTDIIAPPLRRQKDPKNAHSGYLLHCLAFMFEGLDLFAFLSNMIEKACKSDLPCSEAMFADLGHFNQCSIQIAFLFTIYPSLVLTYAGQTAYLIKNPNDHDDGFYKFIPTAVYWPIFIIATLAAIVASQSVISATFSVIKQSVALDYFPRVKVVHTSNCKECKVYSPEVNYILMILCVAVILIFGGGKDIGGTINK